MELKNNNYPLNIEIIIRLRTEISDLNQGVTASQRGTEMTSVFLPAA